MTAGAKTTRGSDTRGPAAVARRLRARSNVRRQRIGVWLMTVAIALFLAVAAPHFYSLGNIRAVLNDTAILGIGAAGMTVLIMAGAFDLSVTSIVGLAPIVAITLVGDSSGPLAVLISIVAGGLLGLVNGLIITLGRVAPFVATLGTLFVFGSIAAIITGGNALNIANDFLLELGTGNLFHFLPYSVLLMAVAFGVAYVVLRRLHVGRWVRAAGSNLRAAHVSGIDLHWVYVFIFVLSGALTGLAGILISGYLASADATQAPNYNLICIAAVVVGGTSFFGGEGTLVGTALASFLFAMVDNGLILLAVNSYWHYVATGAILIVALGIGVLGKAELTSWD